MSARPKPAHAPPLVVISIERSDWMDVKSALLNTAIDLEQRAFALRRGHPSRYRLLQSSARLRAMLDKAE